ncbi:MAG: hypothetical protein LJE63_06330 [Desulfobacteraceae bacterium]|nr:hypothetical protein [Desulfobacteraceae bacterium]
MSNSGWLCDGHHKTHIPEVYDGPQNRDHVPPHFQMAGKFFKSHAPAKIQGVAPEGPGVASAGVGETGVDLPHYAAGKAPQALNGHQDLHRLSADGNTPEAAADFSPLNHVAALAHRTTNGLGLHLHGEADLPFLE